MKSFLLMILLAFAFAAPAQAQVRLGPGGVVIGHDRDRWDDRDHDRDRWRCERLRRACEFKEERGEVGMGNCRRYRRECR